MPTKIAVMMPSAAKISPAGSVPVPAAGPSGIASQAVTSNGSAVNGMPSIGTSTPVSSNGSAVSGAPANGSAINPVPVNGSPVSGSPVNPVPANGSATASSPMNVSPVSAGQGTGAPLANGTALAAANTARSREPERGIWPFDPLAEKPIDRFTLSQKSKEINDIIGGGSASSLNDKLKPDIVDLRSALNDTPIRDLKKAIGVNDRYVFVNQLFRGDEAMYERSIKTINGFRILPEAEYWMERELKVKLGWDENRDVTRHFYQLVKRRFS